MKDWWNENWLRVVIPGGIILFIVLVTLPVWSSWGKPLDRTMHRDTALEVEYLEELYTDLMVEIDISSSEIPGLIRMAVSDKEAVFQASGVSIGDEEKQGGWKVFVSPQAEDIADSETLPPHAELRIGGELRGKGPEARAIPRLELWIVDASDSGFTWKIPLKTARVPVESST